MHLKTLKNINCIIERDSKDTTYKFALLRATIDIVQEQSPYIRINNDRVEMPVGLLVLKWIEYYYPIIHLRFPQKNGDQITARSLAFRKIFESVTDYYADKGGFAVFYGDLINGRISEEIEPTVINLCKKIRETILKQPMQYIGRSVYSDFYKIFQPVPNSSSLKVRNTEKLDSSLLISRFGQFTIPAEYYEVFELMGSFITGTHSILMNWAQFTVDKCLHKSISFDQALATIVSAPLADRNIQLSAKIFQDISKKGPLKCVWSGATITTDLNIDHMLPFSVWRNNELWNLLPAKAKVNNRKRDKIPSQELLIRQKDLIVSSWQSIREAEKSCFDKEIFVSLIDSRTLNEKQWETAAFDSLVQKCRYLIETRGFEAFHG